MLQCCPASSTSPCGFAPDESPPSLPVPARRTYSARSRSECPGPPVPSSTQLLERLCEARALTELAAFLRRGVELAGRDGLVALDAELRAERTRFLDRLLNELFSHQTSLTFTPRRLTTTDGFCSPA